MGSWGYKVGESDTFADVYALFFEQYNNGATPEIATASVRGELNDFFVEYDDRYDAHFALAFAQWETQSLEKSLLEKVEQYIESGADLKSWEERGADSQTLKKRATALFTAPDGKKVFSVSEEFSNGKYIHTGATMMWENGGGSIFYFTRHGAMVSARWVNSQNLEVTIEKGLGYSKRDERAFFLGDKVDIQYKDE